MKYSDDFKRKVFRICRYLPAYASLRKALEESKHNTIRMILEDLVDDDLLYSETVTDNEVKREVRKDKTYAYSERTGLYSEFMEMYNQYLDDGRVLQEDRLHL